MAIRISIYALGTDDERIADVTLPANKNMIIDAMDKAKNFGETFSHIMECKDFPAPFGPSKAQMPFWNVKLK